tara:strand:+ start:2518 stop:3183 length:666 start_codon:yes stop_codon:yes gene_type:complete
MGYQDNSTITVDAILTKQGRKRIAEGKTLDVAYFSLTDNGVSYTLYNTAHPSGSAFYGEAIENLPQLEALPQAEYSMMRNNLVTLNKGTTAMPVVTDVPTSHTFGANRTSFTFKANLLNHAETEGFRMIVPDDTLFASVGSATKVTNLSGNALRFINTQEIADAAVYHSNTGTFNVTPAVVTSQKEISCTIVSTTTGAYANVRFIIKKNDNPTPVTDNPVN